MKTQSMVLCGVLVAAMLAVSGCGLFDDGTLTRVVHEGGTITGNEVWANGDHLITGDIAVHGSLTISACANVELENNVTIIVSDGGSIKSLGTATCPVTFTSAKAVPAAGDWTRIDIYDSASNDNAFTWTTFAYGGDEDYGVLWIDSDATVSVDNCTFSHIKNSAVVIDDNASVVSFAGNTFNAIGGPLMKIAASVVPSIDPVVSTGNSNNYMQIEYGTVEDGGTWQNIGVPFHAGDLYIQAPLTVEAGVTLLMDPGMDIDVSDGGSLKLLGTESAHVTIGSSKAAPAAGDWNEIDVYDSSSNDTRFQYTDIMYGGGSGSYGVLWVDEGITVVLDNVSFDNNETCDISGDGAVTATASPYDFCE